MDDVGNMENDPINVLSHVGSAEIAGLLALWYRRQERRLPSYLTMR